MVKTFRPMWRYFQVPDKLVIFHQFPAKTASYAFSMKIRRGV